MSLPLKSPAAMDFEPNPDDIQRFLAKVSLDDVRGCWVWSGYTDRKGYGQFKFFGRMVWAHRWSYAVFRRPLIAGLTVDHKCRNPSCVNPWHLELMTNSENAANGNRLRGVPVTAGF